MLLQEEINGLIYKNSNEKHKFLQKMSILYAYKITSHD